MRTGHVATARIIAFFTGAGITQGALGQGGPQFDPKRVISYGPSGVGVNETAVAVDPFHPLRIMAAWNTYTLSGAHDRVGFAYSEDGGVTWTDKDGSGNLLVMPVPGGCGQPESQHADPGLAAAPPLDYPSPPSSFVGTWISPCAPLGGEPRLFGAVRDPGSPFFGPAMRLVEQAPHESCWSDFPHIAVGFDPFGFGFIHYEVSFTRSETPLCTLPFRLQIHTSEDGGAFWSTRRTVQAGGMDVQGYFAVPACGGDGRLYIAYTELPSNEVSAIRSDDGGTSFSATSLGQVRVESAANLDEFVAGQFTITTEILSIAVDPNDSDRVYVVYHDLESPPPGEDGDMDVLLLRSVNGGASWEGPIEVNTPDDGVLSDQFFPCIAVDPAGRAHVFWYDTRNDPQGPNADVLIDLYYARVDSGSGPFANSKAVGEAIDTTWLVNPGVLKLGDYIMAAPMPDGAICVFMGTNHPRHLFDEGLIGDPDETIYAKRVHWSD